MGRHHEFIHVIWRYFSTKDASKSQKPRISLYQIPFSTHLYISTTTCLIPDQVKFNVKNAWYITRDNWITRDIPWSQYQGRAAADTKFRGHDNGFWCLTIKARKFKTILWEISFCFGSVRIYFMPILPKMPHEPSFIRQETNFANKNGTMPVEDYTVHCIP